MITKEGILALDAAIDIAYPGDDDDKERLQMESDARALFQYIKDLHAAGRPTGARWAIIQPQRKPASILMTIKGVMKHSTADHTVVVMPQEDYTRVAARTMHLERINKAMTFIIKHCNVIDAVSGIEYENLGQIEDAAKRERDDSVKEPVQDETSPSAPGGDDLPPGTYEAQITGSEATPDGGVVVEMTVDGEDKPRVMKMNPLHGAPYDTSTPTKCLEEYD
jgi:hypothetical protein